MGICYESTVGRDIPSLGPPGILSYYLGSQVRCVELSGRFPAFRISIVVAPGNIQRGDIVGQFTASAVNDESSIALYMSVCEHTLPSRVLWVAGF